METESKRTIRQNRALHKWFTQLAEELNNRGLDIQKTLRHDVEIPWNATTVKELMWRQVQKAQFDKRSTTELSTKELSDTAETLNRFLVEKVGVSVPFPSIDEINNKGKK